MMRDQPIIFPYIPQNITVHLGKPSSSAENITVPFLEYIKNAASSEIYPTWDESALRANILAITSFALNRIYTEFYRSQGYDFDITNSTAVDQAFVKGRSYFSNISQLSNELFNCYIRRKGFVEPLAAKFCNGTTVTCDGLSQWGSEKLARDGADFMEILKTYYGDDIEIVSNVPVQGNRMSYPGTPFTIGSTGPYVTVIQASINRIARDYPAIPKIRKIDGIFGEETKNSIQVFQDIFSLKPDGVVGAATWYKLVRLYVAVMKLAELRSKGQQEYTLGPFPDSAELPVEQLQYMLMVAASFVPTIPDVKQTGKIDEATRKAVQAFQTYIGFPATGIADAATWDVLLELVENADKAVIG